MLILASTEDQIGGSVESRGGEVEADQYLVAG